MVKHLAGVSCGEDRKSNACRVSSIPKYKFIEDPTMHISRSGLLFVVECAAKLIAIREEVAKQLSAE